MDYQHLLTLSSFHVDFHVPQTTSTWTPKNKPYDTTPISRCAHTHTNPLLLNAYELREESYNNRLSQTTVLRGFANEITGYPNALTETVRRFGFLE